MTIPYNDGTYVGHVLGDITSQMGDLTSKANELTDESQGLLQEALGNLTAAVDSIAALEYNPNVSGLDFTTGTVDSPTEPDYSGVFNATPPTVPSAPLLDQATHDQIFATELAKLQRASESERHDAEYRIAKMGIGLSSPALQARIDRAGEKIREIEVKAASDSAIQQGVWEREDTKTLIELGVRVFEAENAAVASRLSTQADVFRSRVEVMRGNIELEAEKRQMTTLELGQILDRAEKEVTLAVQALQLGIQKSVDALLAVASQLSAMGTSYLTAVGVSLGGSGDANMNYSESKTETSQA